MRAVFGHTGCLNPPRKLKGIEEQLQSSRLCEKSAVLRFVDNAQDNEDVNGLLEDLREVVNDYMVRS
jgi:hypothetical protein